MRDSDSDNNDRNEKSEDEDEMGKKKGDYFYEHKVPEVDELVMARVNSIDEMGVLCQLLEYNNLEGFLPLSELSRKRMRSVLRHVRVGQKQVLQVIRVDTERGYTDLSKKYVEESERVKGTEKYNIGKTVHGIVKHLAETKHREVEEIYSLMIWPLYKKYSHPYEAFKLLAASTETVPDIYEGLNLTIPEDYFETLVKVVKHQLAVQPVKIGAEVDVTSFVGGIDDIKNALKAGLSSKGEFDIKIQLVSSPTFLIFTTTTDEAAGTEAIEGVTNVIKDEILKVGGNFVLVKPPHVIGKEVGKGEGESDQ
jgi:translation initiation factor 2 subunit 1